MVQGDADIDLGLDIAVAVGVFIPLISHYGFTINDPNNLLTVQRDMIIPPNFTGPHYVRNNTGVGFRVAYPSGVAVVVPGLAHRHVFCDGFNVRQI